MSQPNQGAPTPDQAISYAQLAEQLLRTDTLLLRAVRRQRARLAASNKGRVWGELLSDEEVEALLTRHGEVEPVPKDDMIGHDLMAFAEQSQRIVGDRFTHLQQAFGLDATDVDLISLVVSAELSAGYGTVYAYLNDDKNRRYCTIDALTRVLAPRRIQRLAVQERFLADAPLIHHRLLTTHPVYGTETFADHRVQVPSRVVQWLMTGRAVLADEGIQQLDHRIEPFVCDEAHNRIEAVAPSLHKHTICVLVRGTVGLREGTAIAIAREVGRPLVRVDMDRTDYCTEQPFAFARDLALEGAIPYLINVPTADEEPTKRKQVMRLGTALQSLPFPVCVGGTDRKAAATLLKIEQPRVTVSVGKSTLDERVSAWQDALRARNWDESMAQGVAERFYAIGGTAIDRVLDLAWTECGDQEPDESAIWQACLDAARPEFGGLAEVVVPRYGWDDLILNDKLKQQLRHLEHTLTYQETVYHTWGGAKIRPRGYGIKALFSGGPGTGKTMCAEVLAGTLKLELFRVDLSQVVSRWVGETEKNLRNIFDAAEGGQSILLFDEGDALFSARGDVKQAQDRFANQEVSFLLQRLETFEGCAILTTNLIDNIDKAFLRRFGMVLEFPMPNVAERKQLWERAIPTGAPRAADLDLDILAKRFRLSGGSIVNAAMNACIVAAAEGTALGMMQCIVAVAREMYKEGKQINSVHFGDYYELIADLF